MAKYCCFNCPEIGHDDKRELNHKCPTCGREYGFPLNDPPKYIGKYEIKLPLSRGFYGAVYQVTDPILDKDYVVKVIPQSIYQLHKKDFNKECKEHADLAKGSQFIVNILDATNQSVTFGNGDKLDCHVAVLDYVPGKLLKDILSETQITAIRVAQIAIDLLRIIDILKTKQKNHNDLHSSNIIVQDLSEQERRSGEIDNYVRVVAIDIGSLTTENKAGDSPDRHGDIHWVANYLFTLSKVLTQKPHSVKDHDYRLASLLQDRARILFPAVESQRMPTSDELIESIKNCFKQQIYPWEEPLKLLNFNDTYNAQTLEPWFVPSLLVDPDDQWLKKISGKGPLVVTGMRGCGKTMMLRALQFHARAASAKMNFKGQLNLQINKLKDEGYVGIYVSCNKLLDEIGKESTKPLHNPYSKLFISYCIEAIKALRHLKSIDDNQVEEYYYRNFVNMLQDQLNKCDLLNAIKSDYHLEQQLVSMIHSLDKGDDVYSIHANPVNVFTSLAQTIKQSAGLWNNQYVLFLLDDVSTRYLGEENIKNLLSSLIFQSEECAFKITSEVQTIELVLYSPGKIEKAKKGRDFESFDLGSAVNQKIRKKGGRQFVLDILNRRAKGSIKHPTISPLDMIGDISLQEIALNIVNRGSDKTLRKQIYSGLSALSGVCVGDIGDIINLYDSISRHFTKEYPIPASLQNECFQELCSTRLHEINRRGTDYKDFAISFAKASHDLLMKSAKDTSGRLRQYYSIYVRITTSDSEKQYEKIRKLLDAGIFVYSGGANTPRTLGNDNNPINQFKLTFRKLYGLSNLIGLTQGDRFELSGADLENWLDNPKNGKEILMKNLGGPSSPADEDEEAEETIKNIDNGEKIVKQEKFVFDNPSIIHYDKKEIIELVKSKSPISINIDLTTIQNENIDCIIAALGFEERTEYSILNLLKLQPKTILLIKYPEKGKSDQIINAINYHKINYNIIDYEQIKTGFDVPLGNILCDVTGLTKSVIFNVVRNCLINTKKIFICHTQAKEYYPTNDEINHVLNTFENEYSHDLLEKISLGIPKCENGPFETYDLLLSDTDESKRNVLIGFSTAKYERLMEIISKRNSDKIQIITPHVISNRDKLAELASDAILKENSNTELFEAQSDDINDVFNYMTLQYQKYYIDQNYNYEIALTGSKQQTIACGAISATFKISHCWYVKPTSWVIDRYSSGVGQQRYSLIKID